MLGSLQDAENQVQGWLHFCVLNFTTWVLIERNGPAESRPLVGCRCLYLTVARVDVLVS